MIFEAFKGFAGILWEVTLALLPLLIFFIFFTAFFLRLTLKKIFNITVGILFTFIGLALFLQGVHVGFLPAGEAMGAALGSLPNKWPLMPIGFILGFVATFAEPAVRVLSHKVENVSGGYIPQQLILYTLSLGVALSIAFSMLRIIYGIPLWHIILPGYLVVLFLALFIKPTFVAIAFDSGGVATGPMTVTFILTLALGVASSIEGRDPLLDGFGMISLVALTPILTVLLLGLLYERRERKNAADLDAESQTSNNHH